MTYRMESVGARQRGCREDQRTEEVRLDILHQEIFLASPRKQCKLCTYPMITLFDGAFRRKRLSLCEIILVSGFRRYLISANHRQIRELHRNLFIDCPLERTSNDDCGRGLVIEPYFKTFINAIMHPLHFCDDGTTNVRKMICVQRHRK